MTQFKERPSQLPKRLPTKEEELRELLDKLHTASDCALAAGELGRKLYRSEAESKQLIGAADWFITLAVELMEREPGKVEAAAG